MVDMKSTREQTACVTSVKGLKVEGKRGRGDWSHTLRQHPQGRKNSGKRRELDQIDLVQRCRADKTSQQTNLSLDLQSFGYNKDTSTRQPSNILAIDDSHWRSKSAKMVGAALFGTMVSS